MIGGLLTDGPARKALGLNLTVAPIPLFLLNHHRAGKRAGRAAELLDWPAGAGMWRASAAGSL